MRTTPVALSLALASLAVASAPMARADGEIEIRRSPIVRAVEKARPGVVSIRTNEIVNVPRWYSWFEYETVPQEREGSLGTGVIFHPDGYVITNAHVIARASRILVRIGEGLSGEMEREARLVSVDLDADLAILRLLPLEGRGAEVYPYLALGRSNDLLIGETVIAIGNPFRLGLTVTTGVVSAVRRSIKPQQSAETEFKDFIQIDAAINPGNSGGPILDVTGRWIGVNTAILNRSTGAEGIGFAIPADRVREMVGRTFKRRLVTGEWLGFEVEAAADGTPRVRDVFGEGPASEAGLRKGDRILAVAGHEAPTLFDYRLAEAGVERGATARLRVRRGDAETDVEVRSAPMPVAKLSRDRLGFEARDLTSEDARTVGAGPDAGVIVTSVVEGGPADRIKLRRLDVITALGDRRIRNLDDLVEVVELVGRGDAVSLRVQRVVQDGMGNLRLREAAATIVANGG